MMYLLDTNVVSELRKTGNSKADKNVIAWTKNIPSSQLFISVITILELEIGILRIERKDKQQGKLFRDWMTDQVLPVFSGRILDISFDVVLRCAALHIPDPASDRDALIAATAMVHGMTVVTRNINDFKATQVTLINPWESKEKLQ